MVKQNNQFIVCIGSVLEGFGHIGPFPSNVAAQDWARTYCAGNGGNWMVVPLTSSNAAASTP